MLTDSLFPKGELIGHRGWITSIATTDQNADLVVSSSRGVFASIARWPRSHWERQRAALFSSRRWALCPDSLRHCRARRSLRFAALVWRERLLDAPLKRVVQC
jgi:hypothetical protein